MTYPPQYPPQGQPPQGYGPPQGPPPGYGQAPPPQQGYGPPPGPPAGYGQPQQDYSQGQQAFSFADVYSQAEPSAGMIPEAVYPAIVKSSEFGRTKNGDKWCWTIVVNSSTPLHNTLGRQLTMTMSLSPNKNDGSPNPNGMGRTFRQLSALGVPVGDKFGGKPGEQPFFAQFPVPQGAPADQQNAAIAAAGAYAAQLMTGRPVRVKVTQDHEWNNNKIADIYPAQPGDPTVMPQTQQAPAMGGYQPGPVAQGYAPPQQAPGYAQPPPQPVGPAAQPPWGGQPQQGGPQAPPPYQAQAPQGPPQGAPGAPPMTPQGYPAPAADPAGQPGVQQFTPQGQAPQGPPAQPPWQPNGAPAQQAAPPQAPPQGAPPAPPWAQPQQ